MMETFVMTIGKWKYNYRLVKRQFWTVMAVLCIGLVVLFHPTGKADRTVEDCLDEAIAEYENNGGHKIYPYGRACLLKRAMEMNYTTLEQMRDLLQSNKNWIEK